MTEVIARRGFHGPSNEEAIEAIHGELDSLWEDASFV
ncbi:serine/threonine protein kinase, partial [Arthrobacter sp. AK-YN10]